MRLQQEENRNAEGSRSTRNVGAKQQVVASGGATSAGNSGGGSGTSKDKKDSDVSIYSICAYR